MVFDGSQFGLPGGSDVDAFTMPDPNTILISFAGTTVVPGVGRVDDSDIVVFDRATETFEVFLDGSLVELTTSAEDVDAVELLPDGTLLVSTAGTPRVSGVSNAADEDILAFVPVAPGDYSAGTWSLYFDGSAAGLSTSAEDVVAFYLDGPDLRLSTLGNYAVGSLSGGDEDIISCDGFQSPATCVGVNLLFDGSVAGLPSAADIDGLSREP